MRLVQLRLNTIDTRRSWQLPLSAACALALGLIFLQPAKGAFVGDYALSNFTLTNTNSDGDFTSPDNGATLILTGPNNGSGLAGTTDFTVTATAPGLITFDYSFSSFDGPGFDFAGYLLGNSFVQLADQAKSGTTQFMVALGETFGFRVGSIDNQGEPGIFTISDFSASASTAPEPGSMLLTGTAVIAAILIRETRRIRGKS